MTHGKSKLSVRLMGGSAAAVLAMLATGAVQAAEKINIAPQPLSSALKEFAAQSQQAILMAPELADQRVSPGVEGATDPELALTKILAGTGLTYRRSGDALLIVQGGADGPQGAGAGGDVDALIVTAQKREENIQDVPIAISAFSQEDLTRSQVAGGPDLITQVPNMTFTKTNFSSYSIQIRGIGTQAISATTDPAVAVAFNNTPFIRNRFFEQEFYDLQRVEVLRGPQGTLYGRNATGGVVNIISAKPKFNFEAKASADVSNYNSTRIEGMVNIPLVEDAVALRLAGAWTKRDGYATNELAGNPIDGRDLWSTRVSLRVAPTDGIDVNLIWEHFQEDDDRLRSGKQLCKKDVVTQVGDVPITNYYDARTSGGQSNQLFAGVQATLSQGCKRNSLYAQDSFQRPNGLMLPYYVPLGGIGLPIALNDPYVSPVLDDPFFVDPHLVDTTNDQIEDLRVIQSTVDPDYRAMSDLGELQISLDLTDTLTLTSETAYSVDQVSSLQDFNRFNTASGAWEQPEDIPGLREGVLMHGPNGGIFCDPQLGCSDRLVAVDISSAEASQFSQELRLASDFDGPFNFSLGANFLRADSEDKYYVFINSLSLISAKGLFLTLDPYVAGQTDNIECMNHGYETGDPNSAYGVQDCTYIDTHPIGQLSDQGHNYFLSKNPYKLISYAVFGEAYYNLADNLKVTAGVRWTVDKKEAPRIPSWVLATQSVGYPVAEVIEQEWREPTGRLTVDWKPDLSFTDETMVYASYAHGYKAGGANPPGFVKTYYADRALSLKVAGISATRPTTFDPEFVDAFEIGSKNTLADGRVTLNLAAFYYDYTGYQVSEIVDRSAFNRNFDATVWGVELESDWRPLENLKLGFKAGYEKTRIKDGEQAIDLMDRTAGREDWVVVRPFPTYASSCILPAYVYANPNGTIGAVGGVGGGGMGGCEYAYLLGVDPVTGKPYVDLTTNPVPSGSFGTANNISSHPGYPGWDPSVDYGNNGGEGFFKPLGGNELPNAPNWTLTGTADYTIPLANDWLATLHTDLHWQSESYWRLFQDHEYSKLDDYFTMNLAAIFTNEEYGWNVMAYIKNVTDETAITGAFLNSDDTGLTTNVFLTEPRLYGVRITKNFTGGSILGSFGEGREGPYPFTLELDGQAARIDAPNETLRPSMAGNFHAPLDIFDDAQDADLDWGDRRQVRLAWRPQGGPWTISAGVKFGKTNGMAKPTVQDPTPTVCIFGGYYEPYCATYADHPTFGRLTRLSYNNQADAFVRDREDYEIIDFSIGREVGFGGLKRSTISAGVRYAQFTSTTDGELRGQPDWVVTDGAFQGYFSPDNIPVTHTVYDITAQARRTFEGMGPAISWDAAWLLRDLGDGGAVSVDWSIDGALFFGDREASVSSAQIARAYSLNPKRFVTTNGVPAPTLLSTTTPPAERYERSDGVTAPMLGVSLGLSYDIDRFKIGAGYRWERYFGVLDGGYTQQQDADRTIDGPYFKIVVGFGG